MSFRHTCHYSIRRPPFCRANGWLAMPYRSHPAPSKIPLHTEDFSGNWQDLATDTPNHGQKCCLRGFPAFSHCAGTSAGAPLSLIKTTRNFAGWVPLALRSTT